MARHQEFGELFIDRPVIVVAGEHAAAIAIGDRDVVAAQEALERGDAVYLGLDSAMSCATLEWGPADSTVTILPAFQSGWPGPRLLGLGDQLGDLG